MLGSYFRAISDADKTNVLEDWTIHTAALKDNQQINDRTKEPILFLIDEYFRVD